MEDCNLGLYRQPGVVKAVRALERAEVLRAARMPMLRRDEAYMRKYRDLYKRVKIAKVRWLKEAKDG